jgi:hypothetical protein
MKRASKITLLCLLIIPVVWSIAGSEESVLLAKREKGSLYMIREDALIPARLYSAPQGKTIESALVSSNGSHIGAILCNEDYLADTCRYKDQQEYKRNKLLIFDAAGNLVTEITDDVRKYVWSPRGELIACINGKWMEGAPESFLSRNVLIFDIEGKRIGEIDEHARDIYWANYDDCLYYITNMGEIYRYNHENKSNDRLGIKGIYLSPDGKYYFSRWTARNEDGYQLYRTSDNRIETERVWQLIKDKTGVERDRDGGQADFVRWLGEKGSKILIEVRKYGTEVRGQYGLVVLTELLWRKNITIDLEKGEVTRIINDVSEGWNGNGDAVVQEKKGTYRLEMP